MSSPERPDISSLLPDETEIDARRRALVGELTRRAGGRLRPAAKRPLLVAVAALLVFSGGVALAAGLFSADEIALEAGVSCYSEPRLRGPELSVTYGHATADPIAKCGRLWRQGMVDSDRGPASPELVACSEPGTGVLVFPGGPGLCERLGLEPLPADYAPVGREAARAYQAWQETMGDMLEVPAGECRSPEEVAKQARGRLQGTEYEDVRVEVVGERPCAAFVDPEGAVIAVLTRTRAEDERQALGARAADALSDLLRLATHTCIAPARFELLARAKLERAELGEVGVKVWRPDDPCTAGSFGFNPHAPRVELAADARWVWESNREGYRRYERAMDRRGIEVP